MNRLTNQELNNLIILLKSSNREDWKLTLNILANPSFKVKRQLCQAVKFARIYFKHPYQLYYYGDNLANGSTSRETVTSSQLYIIAHRCLRYLELYKDYDKRRNK